MTTSNTPSFFPLSPPTIHAAAQAGDVKAVVDFLASDATLLHQRDEQGLTALHWAAIRGCSAVVACLLVQEGIALQASTQRPEKKEHGRNALQWAIAGSHLEAISMFYHADPDERNKKVIFEAITIQQRALAFMTTDARNKALLEEDPRLRALIYEGGDPNEPYLSHYKVRGRSPSFYAELDKKAGVLKVFNKGKKLGEGLNGKEIKPDVSQDVYSLGRLFRSLLSVHVQKKEVYDAVPSLRTFALSAMEGDPSKRPALGDFYAQFTEEYAAFVAKMDVDAERPTLSI